VNSKLYFTLYTNIIHNSSLR